MEVSLQKAGPLLGNDQPAAYGYTEEVVAHDCSSNGITSVFMEPRRRSGSCFGGIYANALLDRVTNSAFNPLDMIDFIRGSGCFGHESARVADYEIFGFDLYIESVVFPLMMRLLASPSANGYSGKEVSEVFLVKYFSPFPNDSY
jgi:hypothetical protein